MSKTTHLCESRWQWHISSFGKVMLLPLRVFDSMLAQNKRNRWRCLSELEAIFHKTRHKGKQQHLRGLVPLDRVSSSSYYSYSCWLCSSSTSIPFSSFITSLFFSFVFLHYFYSLFCLALSPLPRVLATCGTLFRGRRTLGFNNEEWDLPVGASRIKLVAKKLCLRPNNLTLKGILVN
jgi:hypothetical protein